MLNIKDEQLHVDLFIKIYHEILNENPEYDTEERRANVTKVIKQAAELEMEWSESVIGDKIDGLDVEDVKEYVRFYANIRSKALGAEKPYPNSRTNPMKWIKAYEDVDSGKTDFFENKSRQYTKVNVVDNGFDDL